MASWAVCTRQTLHLWTALQHSKRDNREGTWHGAWPANKEAYWEACGKWAVRFFIWKTKTRGLGPVTPKELSSSEKTHRQVWGSGHETMSSHLSFCPFIVWPSEKTLTQPAQVMAPWSKPQQRRGWAAVASSFLDTLYSTNTLCHELQEPWTPSNKLTCLASKIGQLHPDDWLTCPEVASLVHLGAS